LIDGLFAAAVARLGWLCRTGILHVTLRRSEAGRGEARKEVKEKHVVLPQAGYFKGRKKKKMVEER
jgi:hypothetical protein